MTRNTATIGKLLRIIAPRETWKSSAQMVRHTWVGESWEAAWHTHMSSTNSDSCPLPPAAAPYPGLSLSCSPKSR